VVARWIFFSFFCPLVYFLFFLLLTRRFVRTHYGILHLQQVSRDRLRYSNRVPQGSVQIELIFRLLLKITVDWPYNAINKCLERASAHMKIKTVAKH